MDSRTLTGVSHDYSPAGDDVLNLEPDLSVSLSSENVIFFNL